MIMHNSATFAHPIEQAVDGSDEADGVVACVCRFTAWCLRVCCISMAFSLVVQFNHLRH